ncbi:MAG TPA: hypothetical protein VKX46_13030 [Ktedonobacteraceae bacterium]|nr:hypothetical protein [Ktedonobacteraceae bacterium]
MAILVAIILAGLALAFVLYPLYRRTPSTVAGDGSGVQGDGAAAVLGEQEQAARSALQEVEFDYQLGNIADPDYRALRERYMQRAALALKERYQREQEIDEEIDAQLRALKEAAHEQA